MSLRLCLQTDHRVPFPGVLRLTEGGRPEKLWRDSFVISDACSLKECWQHLLLCRFEPAMTFWQLRRPCLQDALMC